ncbi:MAG: hypothetical protein RMA76_21370 [Deltaproteobacteria bacterium]
MKKLRWATGLFLVTAACGGSEPATFTEVQDQVLTPACAFSSCHSTANANNAGMLDLTAGVAFAELVGVNAVEAPDRVLVVAGDVAGSYLVDKIEDTNLPAGAREMPPGQPLSAERIELVRSWIEAGAAND